MPKQSVPMKIGNKTYNLRYTFNSLIRLQDEWGLSLADIDKIFPTQDKKGGVEIPATFFKDLRAFFWAGLLHENKDLTLEEAGDLIEDAGGIIAIVEVLTKAFSEAFPSDEDVEKN